MLSREHQLCLKKKHPWHFWLQLEERLSDFNNCWWEYSWDN